MLENICVAGVEKMLTMIVVAVCTLFMHCMCVCTVCMYSLYLCMYSMCVVNYYYCIGRN